MALSDVRWILNKMFALMLKKEKKTLQKWHGMGYWSVDFAQRVFFFFEVLPYDVWHCWWFKSVLLPKSQNSDRMQLAKCTWSHSATQCLLVFFLVLYFQVKAGDSGSCWGCSTSPDVQVCQERKLSAVKMSTSTTQQIHLCAIHSSSHALPGSRKRNCNVILVHQVLIVVVCRLL